MSIHQDNIECYRNVHKSVYGFNPTTYPETDEAFEVAMKALDRAGELREAELRRQMAVAVFEFNQEMMRKRALFLGHGQSLESASASAWRAMLDAYDISLSQVDCYGLGYVDHVMDVPEGTVNAWLKDNVPALSK